MYLLCCTSFLFWAHGGRFKPFQSLKNTITKAFFLKWILFQYYSHRYKRYKAWPNQSWEESIESKRQIWNQMMKPIEDSLTWKAMWIKQEQRNMNETKWVKFNFQKLIFLKSTIVRFRTKLLIYLFICMSFCDIDIS